MDYKKDNQKRALSHIQYIRDIGGSQDVRKRNNYFTSIFQYKINFLVIFLVTIITCFVLMLVYLTLRSDKLLKNNYDPLIMVEEVPSPLLISESPDIKANNNKDPAIMAEDVSLPFRISGSSESKAKYISGLAPSDDEIMSDLLYKNEELEMNREKRQIPQNIPDCRGRQKECKIILDGVRGISKAIHRRMDSLHKMLVEQGVIKESDPKDVKFRTIVECLQCRNAINHQDEDDKGTDFFLPGFGRSNTNDRIRDILPLFENFGNNEALSSEDESSDEGRNERIPKAPPAITKQVMESMTDSSKIMDNAKFAEILHNTTIIEKELADAINRRMGSSTDPRKYMFLHRPVDLAEVGREETQITRNMDSTPIILPTAETTKTSQQIQYTPQSNWPSIPVCFYGNPSSSSSSSSSSSNFHQINQGSNLPFFTPNFQQQQGTNSAMFNQQIKYLFPNGQPTQFVQPPANLPPMMPPAPTPLSQVNSPTQPPSQFPQFSMPVQIQQQISQQDQQNLPLYCTYIPAPMNSQQQQQQQQQQRQFPFIPNMSDFQRQFVGNAKSKDESKTPGFQRQFFGYVKSNDETKDQTEAKEVAKQNKQISESKSTYDESDEKYYVTECPGFWCDPPYKKCIATHERCDGKVDCIGAEDEIGCPYIGYYSRFRESDSSLRGPATANSDQTGATGTKIQEEWRKIATGDQTGTTGSRIQEDWRKTVTEATGTKIQEDGRKSATGTKIQEEWRKSASGNNWTKNADRNYAIINVVAPTNIPMVIDGQLDIEQSTFAFVLPDMPANFICKRITQTITLDKRCDNVFDCEDASDEENCTCKDYLRRDHPSSICDGHVDCLDGSDEEDCDICNEDQYHCHRSGQCIPKHKRCDLNMDCKLNEDELDCFAFTDGHNVKLDLDQRPHLNREGVLTHYEKGAWRPSCFKSEFRNYTKRMITGQKFCEYLGFKNVESTEEIQIGKLSRLVEIPAMKNHVINYEHSLHYLPAKRETNKTCNGLYIRCKPTLDKKLNVHLKIDPQTKERSYLWPWEASIFVDGKYHCSAVLLENNLLLSNSECSENINLKHNYTIALLGVSSPDLPFKSPYEQLSQIIDIKPVKNSDASLFKLKNSVNMTRYVQPLYLEKRIFPASENDICIALGVNDKRERKMKFLQPVVDHCPKCHRCYVEKTDTFSCSKNETSNWNGNVVCLNNGGWYPAAVFQDRNEECGFATKQILNSIDYIHAHLSQAIDEKVGSIDEPTCEGIRCSLGQCISLNRVCDGIRDCRDGIDESKEYCQKVKDRCENDILECNCSKSELRCDNGKCVSKELFCDGKNDCTDGSDEPASCTCGNYLRLTEPKRVCDGRRHCLDKSDENYQQCLCKDSSFKCHKSPYNGTVACIPQDFVCDGYRDCPEGEDEMEDVCWVIKTEKRDPKEKGEVMRRSFGVLHSECYPRPIQSQREVTNVCLKLGYTSGFLIDGSKISDSQFVPRNDFYMFQLNNYTWISMREDVSFGVWVKPESTCYRLFVHCF